MPRTIRKSLGSVATVAAVATAAVGLTAGGAGAATRTSASGATAATPTLTAVISKKGLKLSGPHTFQAGRVNLSLKAVGAEAQIAVASFKKGYTFADLVADDKALDGDFSQTGLNAAGLKILNYSLDHATIFGGLQSDPGQTEKGSVVLPNAGTYYIWNDSDVPAQPTKLVVTGPEVVRASPHATATVTANSAERFGGSKTLPAKGTITFKNTSTNGPHELSLIHVKTGTTRAQVLASLVSSPNSEPPFVLPGEIDTDIIGQGRAMTITYTLPKGEYVEACFFPDLKTGIPHAYMGMIAVVTLK